jgi:phage-related protein
VKHLKVRERYGFEYAREEEPSRMVPTQELTEEEVLGRLHKVFKDASVAPLQVKEYTTTNLPPSVSCFLLFLHE